VPSVTINKQMKKQIKKILIGIGIVVILAASWIIIKNEIIRRLSSDENDCLLGGNVALVKIFGRIVGYKVVIILPEQSLEETDVVSSEEVVGYLEKIEKDNQIKGIIVEVDSPGGSSLAAEEIMIALKKSSKPIVAVIRETGASAGYLIATGADQIYASKFSDVGSIGVTGSYLDYSKKNENEGVIYQQISAGEFKNTGDPDKPLSVDEKELLMRDVKKVHRMFIEYVAKNRKLPIEAVEKLADGSTMLGLDAKAAGLVDEIGDLNSARDWLRDKIGGEAEVCVLN